MSTALPKLTPLLTLHDAGYSSEGGLDPIYGSESVEAEEDEEERRAFVGNVRLVNGATKHEIRQRLMLAFNTPFYPEIWSPAA